MVDYPDYKTISVNVDDRGVATVEINNGKTNTFDPDVISEVTDAFRKLREDGDVKVATFGSGNAEADKRDIYSAGADLDWMKQAGLKDFAANVQDGREMSEMFEAMHTFHEEKGLINVVSGQALGGGAGFAALGHVIAQENGTKPHPKGGDKPDITTGAIISYTEVKFGIAPAVISTYVMEKLGTDDIGQQNAINLFSTAQRLDAQTALKVGAVDEVVAKENIPDRVAELVEAVLANGRDGLPARPEREPADLAQAADAVTLLTPPFPKGAMIEGDDLVAAIAEMPKLVENVSRLLEAGDRDATMDYAAEFTAQRRASTEGKKGMGAFIEMQEAARAARAEKPGPTATDTTGTPAKERGTGTEKA